MSTEYEVGTKVRVGRRHWLRSLAKGTIVEFDEKKLRWLVEFESSFVGGGIDGNKLYLGEHDFTPIEVRCGKNT